VTKLELVGEKVKESDGICNFTLISGK
jgi:hypothetical protein